MIFKPKNGKSFNQKEAIELMVTLIATDPNSEKKWKVFFLYR
tara:strand:+ start:170 stop:295 length:126 start_codon:yes stop_codon:yes gene_type:complete